MKKLITTPIIFLFSLFCFAQMQSSLSKATGTFKPVPLDKSPMDMCYFPADYPLQKSQGKTMQPLVARVIYGRPQKDNRIIFGDLVPYNQVWRLGANEATEIEFFKDIIINGKKITKGRYTLYAIPTPAKWTIIINKDTDTWGAFVYDEKKDLLRIEEPVQTLTSPVEVFTMNFVQAAKHINLTMAWDAVAVTLPIEVR